MFYFYKHYFNFTLSVSVLHMPDIAVSHGNHYYLLDLVLSAVSSKFFEFCSCFDFL